MNQTTRRFRASALALAALAAAAGVAAAPAAAQQHPNLARGLAADRVYQLGEIDRVDPLSGNVSLTLPIGQSYAVDGGLEYGLSLSYNSKVWDFEEVWSGGISYSEALPARRSNAGIGWLLSPGRLVPPTDPTNATFDQWIYESPDGADRVLYASLHGEGDGGVAGEATTWYTRDGSYLRMRDLGGGVREIDFPDGAIHKFRSDGKLTQIRDRFGNAVTVAYPSGKTELTDPHGRKQTITYVNYTVDGVIRSFVDRVTLTAFGGATTIYKLDYTVTTVGRGQSCVAFPYPYNSSTVDLPLLTGIRLLTAAGSTLTTLFTFSYYTDNADLSCREGAIRQAVLPTRGKIEWTYQVYRLPTEGCSNHVAARRSPGVATKRHLNAAGAEQGAWQYTLSQSAALLPTLCGDQGWSPPYEELSNTITTPRKDKVVQFYSVWPETGTSPNGFRKSEYGLPLTRLQKDSTNTRYLSTRVDDCDTAGANCAAERSTYVAYEQDSIASPGAPQDANRRESKRRVVYHDDGSRYADTTHSDFDGLGHYRQTTTGGNFDAGNARTVYTSFNANQGTYPGTFTMLAPSAAWVLDTFTYVDQTEGGVTARTESCFEAATGFLLRTRTLEAGTAASADDVVVRYSKDARGNVTSEEYFGGDTQSVGTTALCTLSLPTAKYKIDHTYQYGVLKTSKYSGQPFFLVDRDLDASTGKVATSRDVAGLATAFEYDERGRPTWVKPSEDGWVQYTWGDASGSSTPAKVWMYQKGANGVGTLATEELHFDGFGRVAVERRKMPDGTFSSRTTVHDAEGAVTSRTEWGSNDSTYFNLMDPFGRPGKVIPPDGSAHEVLFTYRGVREVVRTVKIGTGRNATTGAITETSAAVTEVYDRQGRLHQVFEPANPDGTSSTTTYTYDVGGRLAQVAQTAKKGTTASTQNRYFTYDNRGFLLSEKHPEKGTSGNGTVTYSSHDARGHATRKVDGPNDLRFTYDAAERLTKIEEAMGLGLYRNLKTFTYGTANASNDDRLGKVQVASRYNYPTIGGTTHTAIIAHTHTYGGKQGRVSARETILTFNGTTTERFTQGWTWNDLGEVASRSYPQCAWSGCSQPVPRTVSSAFTNGFLTGVTGYASSITYHPNGQVNQIVRPNDVTDVYGKDPKNMLRPASIAAVHTHPTTGVQSNRWSSGTYGYDGAGNVVKVGSSYWLYDGVSRVVEGAFYLGATGAGVQATFSHTFDGFGNLQALTTATTRNTPTSATTNRLTGTVGYDGAGNLTSWNGATYEYDRLDRMTRMVSGSEKWLYMYDADDERIWAFKEGASPRFDRWTLRDLDGRLLRTYEASGTGWTWTWTEDHVYRATEPLAAVAPSGTTHLHLDHLGTVRAVTDSAGTRKSFHAYYPFGEEATSISQNTQRLKFTGHERDLGATSSAADDLDYMHARFYNPQTGRFLGVDPLRRSVPSNQPQTWNRIAYSLGNPLKYRDPDGRETKLVVGGHTEDNYFGHVAVAVDDIVFSYGTRYVSSNGDWGVSLQAYLAAQDGDRVTTVLTLNVSGEQERQLLDHLRSTTPAPVDYSLVNHSCVTVCESALEAAGILGNEPGPVRLDYAGNEMAAGAPKSFTPRGLVSQVRDAGLVKGVSRSGAEQVSIMESFVDTLLSSIGRAFK